MATTKQVKYGDIRDKFKKVKYQHLKRIYTKNLSPLPENCIYNKQMFLPNKSKLNICIFNIEDSLKDIDLCYKPEHSRYCSAFCPKKNKERLYNDFINDILDDQVRATKFKDINILFWMMPELSKEVEESRKNLKNNSSFLSKIISFLKKLTNFYQ